MRIFFKIDKGNFNEFNFKNTSFKYYRNFKYTPLKQILLKLFEIQLHKFIFNIFFYFIEIVTYNII